MALPRSSAPLEAHLVAIGVPVTVRCLGSRAAELHAEIVSAWSDCLELPTDDDVDAVTVDCRLGPGEGIVWDPKLVGGTDLALVMDRLSPTITEQAIRAQRGRLLMLHACGLADPRTGATVVLAATSGTGKTTLARTLCSDLAYVTDETIAVRRDGNIVPYPKPLSVLSGRDAAYKTQTPASAVGLGTLHSDAHVAGFVVLRRESQHSRVHVETVPTLPALAALAPHGSLLGELDRPLAWMAGLLHQTRGLHRVHYAEAETLRPLVSALAGAA